MKICNINPYIRFILFCFVLALTITSCKKEDCNCTPGPPAIVYDVTDGLVAHHTFTSGTLQDSSSYNNDIASNSATATTDRFGKPNNAFDFNGTSSSMRMLNSPSLNQRNITLYMIFKIRDFNFGPCHNSELISKGYPDFVAGSYTLRVGDYATPCGSPPNTNNEMLAGGVPGGIVTLDTVTLKKDIWYHSVYTFDGVSAKLYLNGELKKEQTISAVNYTSNSFDVYIGRNESPSFNYFFDGVIDEVRIYNRALPSGAIKQLYNRTE